MSTHRLEIEGMSCDHCIRAVRAVLEELPAVTTSDVHIGSALIDSDGSADTMARVLEAIEKAGYRLKGMISVK